MPSTMELFGRDGNPAINLEGENIHYDSGSALYPDVDTPQKILLQNLGT